MGGFSGVYTLGGDTHAIAFATTTPPTARFEGLTRTIARANAMEGALAAIAQAQAQTSASIVQLASSVAALVQHAGISNALPPPPPPAAPARTYAAIAGVPVPAVGAVAAIGDGAVMEVAAAGAVATAGPSWHGLDDASGRGRVDARGRVPVRGDRHERHKHAGAGRTAGVSMRTRASLAIATMLASAPGTAQGTVEGPLTMAAAARKQVRFADEWEDEYDAETDESESEQADRVFFGNEDDDGDPGDGDIDMQQRDGESGDAYEARLNGKVPSSMHFCCRPTFS